MKFSLPFIFSLILLMPQLTWCQNQYNYLEKDIPNYKLPDLLVDSKGNPVQSVQDWENIRRPEILQLMGEHVYGHIRNDFDEVSFELVNREPNPLPDKAILKQVAITVKRQNQQYTFLLDLFLPKDGKGPYPVFLMVTRRNKGLLANEYKLGSWPVEEILDRGYAISAFHVSDVAPDDKRRFTEGILNTLYPEEMEKPNGMRAISAWAWAAMRVMDYFEQDNDIDISRSAMVGHSRSGKAALWAGANDTRWAITISNQSGAGGAAISRRAYGETVSKLNSSFPHWFADNFAAYNDKEKDLPVDQHFLVGAIAPRAVYVASAKLDRWSDPKGEYLGLTNGIEVHQKIYGLEIDLPEDFLSIGPPENHKHAGYHLRAGKHAFPFYDWERFLDFADLQFK